MGPGCLSRRSAETRLERICIRSDALSMGRRRSFVLQRRCRRRWVWRWAPRREKSGCGRWCLLPGLQLSVELRKHLLTWFLKLGLRFDTEEFVETQQPPKLFGTAGARPVHPG